MAAGAAAGEHVCLRRPRTVPGELDRAQASPGRSVARALPTTGARTSRPTSSGWAARARRPSRRCPWRRSCGAARRGRARAPTPCRPPPARHASASSTRAQPYRFYVQAVNGGPVGEVAGHVDDRRDRAGHRRRRPRRHVREPVLRPRAADERRRRRDVGARALARALPQRDGRLAHLGLPALHVPRRVAEHGGGPGPGQAGGPARRHRRGPPVARAPAHPLREHEVRLRRAPLRQRQVDQAPRAGGAGLGVGARHRQRHRLQLRQDDARQVRQRHGLRRHVRQHEQDGHVLRPGPGAPHGRRQGPGRRLRRRRPLHAAGLRLAAQRRRACSRRPSAARRRSRSRGRRRRRRQGRAREPRPFRWSRLGTRRTPRLGGWSRSTPRRATCRSCARRRAASWTRAPTTTTTARTSTSRRCCRARPRSSSTTARTRRTCSTTRSPASRRTPSPPSRSSPSIYWAAACCRARPTAGAPPGGGADDGERLALSVGMAGVVYEQQVERGPGHRRRLRAAGPHAQP